KKFARAVIDVAQVLRDDYVLEVHEGELVSWAIRGLCVRTGEWMPSVEERLKRTRGMKESELTVLLEEVHERLEPRQDLNNRQLIELALEGMLRHLEADTTIMYRDPIRSEPTEFVGVGLLVG